jgi:hypothetical protein
LWREINQSGWNASGILASYRLHTQNVKDVEELGLGLFGNDESLASEFGHRIGNGKTGNSKANNCYSQSVPIGVPAI